jgi:hypothetical protein
MARKDNITALALMLGLVNDPEMGLNEDELKVGGVMFHNMNDGQRLVVGLTDNNKAGRLFFQQFLNEGITTVPMMDAIRVVAKIYFAEAWTPEPNEKQSLIFGIRMFDFGTIVPK